MKHFEGSYAALVTPFDGQGHINADALGRLIERNLERGIRGFYVSGSTGESFLLSMEERKYLTEAVTEAVDGRGDVIVNVGMFATEHGITLAEHAQSCGVDAISSVPPFYFPFQIGEYMQYYYDLADAVDVPVIVYNIPALSGVKFSTEELSGLLSYEKIAGIKHTSFDLFQLEQLVSSHPDKTVFIGYDEIYLSALSAGARAGIGSTYNIMPEKFVRMNELFSEGRMEEALQVQSEVNNVVAALGRVGIFKGIKEILRMQGIDCGVCRRPFLPLDEAQRAYLRKAGEQNGIL